MTLSEAIKLVEQRKLPYCYQVLYWDHEIYVGSEGGLHPNGDRLRAAAERGKITDIALHFSNQEALVRLVEADIITKYWTANICLLNETNGWVNKYKDWKHYADGKAWFISEGIVGDI